jgi:hypothetical protein
MDLLQAAVEEQPPVGTPGPVIEIAGNDQRRIAREFLRDEIEEPADLPPTMRLPQCEVQADRMQWLISARHSDYGVKKPSSLRAAHRRVDVAPGFDGIPGEERIAVMPAGIDGIPAIGVLGPDTVREDLVLMHGRPGGAGCSNLLQEDEIRLRGAQGCADAEEDFLPTTRAETLPGVQGQNADPPGFVYAWHSFHAATLYPEA